MFSIEEAAILLDVETSFIRSQVNDRRGLCHDKTRPRGAGLLPDELLALAVLKSVQRITGEKSPAAQEIVRQYRPFLAGVLTSERSITDVMVPLVKGDVTIHVQLRIPWLPGWLRERVALLRAGKPVPTTAPGALDVEGVLVRG